MSFKSKMLILSALAPCMLMSNKLDWSRRVTIPPEQRGIKVFEGKRTKPRKKKPKYKRKQRR